MIRYTRRQLALYAADALLAGKDVVPQLAAYLVESHRTKEVELLVWDIEKVLASRGTMVAKTTSARELDEAEKAEIEKLLTTKFGAKDIVLKSSVDESLLGGVVVRTASNEFDGSLKRSINRLKALKV